MRDFFLKPLGASRPAEDNLPDTGPMLVLLEGIPSGLIGRTSFLDLGKGELEAGRVEGGVNERTRSMKTTRQVKIFR